jgi:serine/threonine protein kinase
LDAKVVHDFVLLPLADEPAERSEVVQMVLAVRDRLDHFKRSRAAAAERRRPMPPRTLVVDDADDAVEPPPPKLRPASLGVKAMEQLRAPAGPSAAAGPSPGAAGAVSSPRVPNPAGARRQRDDDSAASVAAASDLSHDSRVGQVHASRLLDQTNRRVGTPPYLAPEVVKDALYSRASEYWALGCVIYELVTTERLFDGPTVESVLERIATRPDRSRKIMELTHASMELKLFIAQLVSVEIPERLGVDPDDPPREHVFFSMAPEADAFSWEEFE